MLDETGGGLDSVMSRRRFHLVYRLVVYSRQCAVSCGSGGASKAGGIYISGCTGPTWVNNGPIDSE